MTNDAACSALLSSERVQQGVEMAGAIADLARKALAADFRTVDPSEARIVLIEAGPRVLPSFGVSSSSAAARALEKLGVEVWLRSDVTGCDANGVDRGRRADRGAHPRLGGWVIASKAGEWLDAREVGAARAAVGHDGAAR